MVGRHGSNWSFQQKVTLSGGDVRDRKLQSWNRLQSMLTHERTQRNHTLPNSVAWTLICYPSHVEHPIIGVTANSAGPKSTGTDDNVLPLHSFGDNLLT